MGAEYDGLAWYYERWWRDPFHIPLQRVLDTLFYPRVRPSARVLDLCCGTGHLSRVLHGRRYRVVGIDSSMDMLRVARHAVPRLPVVCADASRFGAVGFDAVVCTFDSVNHLTSLSAVEALLECVRRALCSGGLFLFDINTPPAFASEWGKSSAVVTAEAALFVRGHYDAASRLGHTEITTFRLCGGWQRADHHLVQRCYEVTEIAAALRRAGFGAVDDHPADSVGMDGDIGVGRVFFTAVAP
jgi:SAM-dependent methyltransferase